MGYHIDFCLTFPEGFVVPPALAGAIKEKTYLEYQGNRWFAQDLKWYDWEKAFRELSAEFPEILFTLRGHGEEVGDDWQEYYQNGKMQHVKGILTFAPFDSAKLADPVPTDCAPWDEECP